MTGNINQVETIAYKMSENRSKKTQVDERPPKTFVIGGRGFIGNAFLKTYQRFDPNTLGTHHQEAFPLKKLDLLHLDLDALRLKPGEYSYAIIAAAIANIPLCEKQPALTHEINVTGTLQLVDQLCRRNITPVLFSSDYVYDGKIGFYDEHSLVNPLNEYGRQKVELEREIAKRFNNQFLLIRPGKVFGLTKGDGTLLDEMAHALNQQKPIRVATDQIFCPISIDDLIKTVIQLQKIGATGVYHVSGNEAWSRQQIAQAVCRALHAPEDLIQPISLDELNEPFVRPKRTNMTNRKVCVATGCKIESLQSSIETIVRQYEVS
jgi:dTDP-4-dehydrorhamnose reductase